MNEDFYMAVMRFAKRAVHVNPTLVQTGEWKNLFETNREFGHWALNSDELSETLRAMHKELSNGR